MEKWAFGYKWKYEKEQGVYNVLRKISIGGISMSVYSNLKVSTKLRVKYVIMIVLITLIGYIGITRAKEINQGADSLYYNHVVRISAVNVLNKNYSQNLESMLSNEKEGFNEKNEKRIAENNEKINLYKAGITREEDKEVFNKLEEDIKSYRVKVQNYLRLSTSGMANEALNEVESIKKSHEDILSSLDKMIELNNKWAKETIDSNEKVYGNAIKIIIGITLTAYIVSTTISFVIIKSIERSLRKTNEFANRLSEYDFSTPLELNAKNEFGVTAKALNKARENISSLIKEVISASENIAASSQELSASVQEVASKFHLIDVSTGEINNVLQDTSASSQQIAASSEEVDASVNILSNKAVEGSSNAEKIKDRAKKARDESREGFKNAAKVYSEVEGAILVDIEKGKVVEEIKTMAETIDSIAQQTNLLALNAAIEAARARESGHGFAVVAEEVRRLAEQSSNEVQNVKNTIDKVQEAFKSLSDNSRQLLEFMDSKVKVQFERFIEIGEKYETDGDFVSSMSEELASMTQEISSTMNQVSEAIQSMAQMTEKSSENLSIIKKGVSESNSAINKIAESALNQADTAQNLNNMISNFKV